MSLIKQPSEIQEKKNLVMLVYGSPGDGKAQPVDCKVLTPSGYRRIGDLRVGDTICDTEGNIQTVEGIFPQGIRPTYEITTNDGARTLCDIDHIWRIRYANGNARKSGWKDFTLRELLDKGLTRNRDNDGRRPSPKFEIPVAVAPNTGSKMEDTWLIAPYVLGVLLGDGSLTGTVAMFSNPDIDSFIKDKVEGLLPQNYTLKRKESTGCPQYEIVRKENFNGPGFIQLTKGLGINVYSGLKAIPLDYLYASPKSRLELLRGLMDTDGNNYKGRYTFTSKSLELAKGVVSLVRSLGGKASLRMVIRKEVDDGFIVNMQLPVCPFSLPRKVEGWKAPKTIRRYIAFAERVEDQECVCIKVSNPNELYITDNYIVTHNTTLAISAPKPVLLDMDGGIGRTLAAHRCPVVQGLDGKPLPWMADPANKVDGEDEPSVLGALAEIRTMPFNTIVVDTVGKLLDAMSDAIMRTNPAMRQRDGSLSLKGYGARKRMFKDFVSQCLAMGKNVVFIAHAQETKVGDDIKVSPIIGGSSETDLMTEIDLAGYLTNIGGKRLLFWGNDGSGLAKQFVAKNTCFLPNVMEVPVVADAMGNVTAPNTFLQTVIDHYNENQEKKEETNAKYAKLVKQGLDLVCAAETVEHLNKLRDTFSETEHIYDSKIILGKALNERAKKLGCKFSKIDNAYVSAEVQDNAEPSE